MTIFQILVSVRGTSLSVNGFRSHIQAILPNNVVRVYELEKASGRRVKGLLKLHASITRVQARQVVRQLKAIKIDDRPVHAQVLIPNTENAASSNRSRGEQEQATDDSYEIVRDVDGSRLDWKDSKAIASRFFEWLHQRPHTLRGTLVDLNAVDRDPVHDLFEKFVKDTSSLHVNSLNLSPKDKKKRRHLESLAMAMLKKQKLLRSKRYSDGLVVCSFARLDKTFAPPKERKTAREEARQKRQEQQADKGGISISQEPMFDPRPNQSIFPINQTISVTFSLARSDVANELGKITLLKTCVIGHHKNRFSPMNKIHEVGIKGSGDFKVHFTFKTTNLGVSRAAIIFTFLDGRNGTFTILRYLCLKSGDSDLYDILKPTTTYEKKKRKVDVPVDKDDIVGPPPAGQRFKYRDLQVFKVPLTVKEMVESNEMEGALVKPKQDMSPDDLAEAYTLFWQNLEWIRELQAYEDIKLFDMEDVALNRSGKLFKLYVSGLAEGRPSVLRGDLVRCRWNGKEYQGRVFATELLDVLLEFARSFHRDFDVSLDRVELVRFTFGRTTFRTSHAGCLDAPKFMGPAMLMPTTTHVAHIKQRKHGRVIPEQFAWGNRGLNKEQMDAVTEIARGTLRPMPYVIFGPPGTGKTTTLTESVYQLARLHKYRPEQKPLKILLVAPSNDAADILVEQLAPYFPTSEMIRVLAYTRSINQVSEAVKPYVRDGLEPQHVIPEIRSVQITVSTVNLAARLWYIGESLPKGYFDVLCVDEAGYATELEVIGVAAKMNFHGKNPAQLVLAGDPNQLGPIITSELCTKCGMGVSYMERLVKSSPAYNLNLDVDNENATGMAYPPGLVTLLVRNYRSHPAILKLPNEMFYDNKLIASGDHLVTHSCARWEHLPNKGFPIVFHAVDGENMREGSSPSWFNVQEATLVVEYVKLLAEHSKPKIRQDEIGVITPYARQVQKIQLALKTRDLGGVKVGSVETFQGQERRCIIISTVRSENDLLQHDKKYNLGFVANEKRFNVAVTRAKALLIVIGNPRVLATDQKNWLPFLRYCRDNRSWIGEEWSEDSHEGDEEDDDLAATSPQVEEALDEDWQLVDDQLARGFINREE